MAIGLSAAVLTLVSCSATAVRHRSRVQRQPGAGAVGKVVTLGDSFSAGTGIHTYGSEYSEEFGGFIDPYEFTPRPDRDCWREKETTPGARYAASHGMESIMLACKGAMKEHVGNQFAYLNEQYQAEAAMKWNNSVVLVGLGGNDLRTVRPEPWSDVIVRCVTERPCHTEPLNQLGNLAFLEDTLAELFTNIAQEASAATIRVMGYPRLFGRVKEGSWHEQGCWNVVWIMRDEADWIDDQVDRLDERIKAATNRAKAAHPNVDIKYVSTLDYVTRGACSNSTERMINKEVITWSGISDQSFHPSQLGFDAFYNAFMDSLSA